MHLIIRIVMMMKQFDSIFFFFREYHTITTIHHNITKKNCISHPKIQFFFILDVPHIEMTFH